MSEVRVSGVNRSNNAQLMVDCAALGYLGAADETVVDLTYGYGRFWRQHRPARLVTNDLRRPADLAVDWTDPQAWRAFVRWRPVGCVVFDPPYKLNGAGGSHPSDEGYGVAVRATPAARMAMIFAGLRTCRAIGPRYVLVKCQDQIVSGRKVWQTWEIAQEMARAGDAPYRLRDLLQVGSYRAQPAGRRQLHARQDFSTLLVFEGGGAGKSRSED